MTDELIKRLRRWANFGYGVNASKCMIEACDALEASNTVMSKANAALEAANARIAELEAAAKAEPIYQTCFIQGQWRDVDRFEYDRAKGLRDDLARIVYTAPAALAQPLEAQADARDAERYRWLRERFTGYDFDWMSSEPDADDGKSVAVFNVGRDFRGGRDITAAIDAALANQKQAG